MNNVIVTKQLCKVYNDKIKAVDDVNLNIKSGGFYAIKGQSGSGKTTLLNLIGLLDDISSGDILVDGKSVLRLNNIQKAQIRMKKFGFVFQSFFLNPKLKAYENVMLPMFINSQFKFSEMKPKAIELLKTLNLESRYDHFPKELSGGEQQRVAIARALANEPECIFADEPTGNLDGENEKVVLDILKGLSVSGKSVVVVSHNDVILKYADEVLYMTNGKLEGKANGN